jgi:hypothetical protein
MKQKSSLQEEWAWGFFTAGFDSIKLAGSLNWNGNRKPIKIVVFLRGTSQVPEQIGQP